MKSYLFNVLMMTTLGAFFANIAEVHFYTLNRSRIAEPELSRIIPIVGNYNKIVYISKGDLWLLYTNYLVGGASVATLVVLVVIGVIDIKKV